MTTSAGKGHARRRRGLAAAERVGAIIGDAIDEIGVRAQTRFARQAGLRGEPLAAVNVAELAAGDDPTPQVDPTGMFDDVIWVDAVKAAEDEIGGHVLDELHRVGVTARITQPFVQEIVAQHLAAIEAYGDEARRHVQETLTSAFRDGASVADTTDRLVAGSMRPRAAELVARTEMIAAGNGAAMVGARAAVGPGAKKTWLSTPDQRTRSSHRSADGQEVPVDQKFQVGAEQADYPGDPHLSLAERGNCFTGDTKVIPIGAPQLIYRHLWQGDLIEIQVGDDRLTGTPNHPVLTDLGWARLGDLQPGDYLVTYGYRVELVVGGVAGLELDVDRPPATFEEIYDLATLSGVATERIRSVAVDFHGDRPYSDVDVVSVERLLLDWIEPPANQLVDDLLLASADDLTRPLASRGSTSEFVIGSDHAANGLVGGLREALASVGAFAGHADPAGVRHSAESHARPSEETGDADPAPLRTVRDREHGFPGQVSLNQVRAVRRYRSTTHVYNLQTSTGIYSAGGIVAHNCRCTFYISDLGGEPGAPPPAAAAAPRPGFVGVDGDLAAAQPIVDHWLGLSAEERRMGGMGNPHDRGLISMAQQNGYAGLPRHVAKEADLPTPGKLKVRGPDGPYEIDNVKIYRGVSQAEHAADYKSGEYYAGEGIHGSGNYFSTDEKWVKQNYVDARGSKDAGDRAIVAALDEGSNLVDARWLDRQIHRGDLGDQLRSGWKGSAEALEEFMEDPGRVATSLGYDAMYVDRGDEAFVVVLNRAATTVVKS